MCSLFAAGSCRLCTHLKFRVGALGKTEVASNTFDRIIPSARFLLPLPEREVPCTFEPDFVGERQFSRRELDGSDFCDSLPGRKFLLDFEIKTVFGRSEGRVDDQEHD